MVLIQVGKNNDLRDQVVGLRQTVERLQPERGSLLDAMGFPLGKDGEFSKDREKKRRRDE